MRKETLDKYKSVIDHWLVNGYKNAEAYQKVYPNAKHNNAKSGFSRIIAFKEIKDYIAQRKEEVRMEMRSSHTTMLHELENWMYADMTQFMLLSPEEIKALPVEVRRLILRYEAVTTNYVNEDGPVTKTTVKVWGINKERAADMLAKHTGFFEMDNKQKNNVTVELSREERDARIAEIKAKVLRDSTAQEIREARKGISQKDVV